MGYSGYGVRPANGDLAWTSLSLLETGPTYIPRIVTDEIRNYLQFLEDFHYEQTHRKVST